MKFDKRVLTGIAAIVSMFILILDSKTAYLGAYEGIILCFTTVIPSLFPFLVLSSVITAAVGGRRIPLLNYLGRLCRIPVGSEPLLLIGLIGGYPVGAQCITNAKKSGQLTDRDAKRMLGFCNNAGPAFIFGMTGQLFQNRAASWVLWLIHILSALAVGAILPGEITEKSTVKPNHSHSASIGQSVRTMGTICGWIVMFRIVIAFCQRWFLWLFPIEISVVFQGVLELSNGCVALNSVKDESLRFVVCSGILAFGGICVWMQTLSVTDGISTVHYLPGKLLQTCISCAVSSIFAVVLFSENEETHSPALLAVCCALITLFVYFLAKKSSSNRQKSVV